ncbi:hypothetical protein Bca52824_079961 [Brassica carinata]|uniref:Uncharacterized protein n=1 Tax=Brassica carinata TaxID=52824 RepID=A0A8X7Q149_BRACI|nr:hypothetical protein Bca52824_079961 [Brassica carinata]
MPKTTRLNLGRNVSPFSIANGAVSPESLGALAGHLSGYNVDGAPHVHCSSRFFRSGVGVCVYGVVFVRGGDGFVKIPMDFPGRVCVPSHMVKRSRFDLFVPSIFAGVSHGVCMFDPIMFWDRERGRSRVYAVAKRGSGGESVGEVEGSQRQPEARSEQVATQLRRKSPAEACDRKEERHHTISSRERKTVNVDTCYISFL